MNSDDLLTELRASRLPWNLTESNEAAARELEARGLVEIVERDEFYGRKRGGREFVRKVREIRLRKAP